MSERKIRIGVDVGGTNTDICAVDEGTGQLMVYKLPSSLHDQSAAVVDGVRVIAKEYGFAPTQVDRFMHGTTVATNAKANLIKPDTWYDAVMTYNGKNITLYLNGKVVKSAPAVIPDVKNTFTIGATANRGGGYAFQGLVKNMKLYEKALSPEEVIELK